MTTIFCNRFICSLSLLVILSLSTSADGLYFPPVEGEWETVEPSDIGWDNAKIQLALDYARSQQSTGVVVLHRGKMLAEQYWQIAGANSAKFNQRLIGADKAGRGIEDVASAQKSVASVLVGIAQQKGLLKVDDPVSQYLGDGWSPATPHQERAITIRHLITMTSGLNTRGEYDVKPGSKWLYNTAVYSKSMDVVEAAAKLDRHELTRMWLTEPIGMLDSKWASRGEFGERGGNAFGFATTARDLARFGLMMLAKGTWGEKVILSDHQYFEASTTSSQKLNPYYGYLWWLSKNSFAPDSKARPESAPKDMFAANGALNRRCFVVPSLNLVVTRLGDQPADVRNFDDRFWRLLMEAAPK